MRRFLTFCLCLVLMCGFTVHAEEIEEPKNLYAQAAVLMDAETGRILFEKSGQEILPMASTTKIMTCILALEKGKLDDVVTATANAAAQPKVHLGMREGEQFYLRDLLYSLMLESHNDSAVAIAEHLAGSVEDFAALMNKKAKELGCHHTYFLTPNGLDAADEQGSHSTTAEDLARIMSYCIIDSEKKEDFLTITGTPNYTFTDIERNRTFGCTNHNSFLTMMDGAISGKTGFTGKAGYCYVGAVRRDGRTFVVSLLECGWPNNKNYKWKDMQKLMQYALDHYQYRDVYEEIDLPDIPVENGIAKTGGLFENAVVPLTVEKDGEGKLEALLRTDETVEMDVEYEEMLTAPISRGNVVGTVRYSLNGDTLKEYPVVVAEDVKARDMKWCFEQIFKLYFCGI